jgi:hypothetical protein
MIPPRRADLALTGDGDVFIAAGTTAVLAGGNRPGDLIRVDAAIG